MTWLIIVGVFLLALGPIFLALPSARDRRLAALRAQARQHGLSVQMTQLPHPAPSAAQQVSAGGVRRTPMLACAAYRLPLQRAGDQAEDGCSWRLQRRAGATVAGLPVGWVWFPAEAQTQAPRGAATLLARADADVLAIEGARGGVCVYWLETPGADRLTDLLALLTALRELQRNGAPA